MLENVLQVGRSDASPLELRRQQVAIRSLCQTIIDEIRSTRAEAWQQRDVRIQLPPEDVVLELDPQLLRNILGNLLANAIKYSYVGARVQLTVDVDGESLRLEVQDEGIGIAAADMPELFVPFHRGVNVGNIDGTGLGLSIVKASVDRQQGHIEVTSEPGIGTCFKVRIPNVRAGA
jgi:signal transduction histidine kinase